MRRDALIAVSAASVATTTLVVCIIITYANAVYVGGAMCHHASLTLTTTTSTPRCHLVVTLHTPMSHTRHLPVL